MRLFAMLAPDFDTIRHNGKERVMEARASEKLAYQYYHVLIIRPPRSEYRPKRRQAATSRTRHRAQPGASICSQTRIESLPGRTALHLVTSAVKPS